MLGLTASAVNEAEQATEHDGSDDASHDERSVGARPGDPVVAQCKVCIGENPEHGEQADANEDLHEDLARDRKAACLVWVQVHAEEQSTEPGHPQARNGHAVRVGVPVRKVVAVLDHGHAVRRGLERGGPTGGTLHIQLQDELKQKRGLYGAEAERAAGPAIVELENTVGLNGLHVAQRIDGSKRCAHGISGSVNEISACIKGRVQEPVGVGSVMIDTLCIAKPLCADSRRFCVPVAAIVVSPSIRAFVSVRTISTVVRRVAVPAEPLFYLRACRLRQCWGML